jgi:hypothetical protein
MKFGMNVMPLESNPNSFADAAAMYQWLYEL